MSVGRRTCAAACVRPAGRYKLRSPEEVALPHAPPLNKRLLTFAAAVSTVRAVRAVTIAVTAGTSRAANACSAGYVGLT